MAVALRREQPFIVPGHTEDVGRLFEEYSDRIFGYCLRRLGCRSEAEDAVQTTFLHAHRALQRGVVPESESAWLHTIAKNVCRWQQRTIARRGRLASEVDLDALAAPSGLGEDNELLIGLDEALASLPEAQRRALLLREWRGLSCQEVASNLGLSPPAAHALLTRARRSLAKALTALPRKPVLSLDLGSVLCKLKALFAGASAKAVATTVVLLGVAAGGVSIEKALDGERAAPRVPVPTHGPRLVDTVPFRVPVAEPAEKDRAGSSTAAAQMAPAPGGGSTATPTGGGVSDTGVQSPEDAGSPPTDTAGEEPPAVLPPPSLPTPEPTVTVELLPDVSVEAPSLPGIGLPKEPLTTDPELPPLPDAPDEVLPAPQPSLDVPDVQLAP